MTERRVVITGVGVYTPLGRDTNELWDNLLAGNTAIRDITLDHPQFRACRSHIASYFTKNDLTSEVIGSNYNTQAQKEIEKRMSHPMRISLHAAIEAVNDSRIFEAPDGRAIGERMGAAVGAGFGGVSDLEANAIIGYNQGLGRVNRFLAPNCIPGSSATSLSRYFGLHVGTFPSIATACASGLVNPMYIYDQIVLNRMDAGLAGGTGDLSDLSFAGFDRLGALSTHNDKPWEASRPFDKHRDGFVFGDGAGMVVLEEYEHATKRGAKIYGEILGFGATGDAFHLTAPDPSARYAAKAMTDALQMAVLRPSQIDYINAHGTSTPDNDSIESQAIKQVFGEDASNPHINSTKSMLGHTLNAAGVLELIVTLKSMQDKAIHQTKNLREPDIENGCDLNYVSNGETVMRNIQYAMTNSFAFGGRNVSLIVGKV